MPYSCKTHRQLQKSVGVKHTTDRPSDSKRLRNGVRWQKFRRWFKSHHPLCVDPLGLHPHTPEPTAHVHHIVGLLEDISLALVESNCAALCTWCHGKIEGMERSGKPTKHLFTKDKA